MLHYPFGHLRGCDAHPGHYFLQYRYHEIDAAGVHAAYFKFENQTGTAAAQASQNFYGFLNAFWIIIVTALGLGLLWLALTHFLPRRISQIAHVAAAVVLIALGFIIIFAWSAYFIGDVDSLIQTTGGESRLLSSPSWWLSSSS